MTARRNDPLLGLATTEVLFRELISRLRESGRAIDLAEMLGGLSAVEREYRPVDQ